MNLILLYGPPASGKLTVANELVRLTGHALLDNHKATDYLPHLFPRSVESFGELRTKLGRQIRLILFEAAAKHNVDLITTFAPISEGRHDFVRNIINTVEKEGGKVLLVQLLPSIEALESRVTGESRKGGKAETVERLRELMVESPAMFEKFPDTDHLVIDNSAMEPDEVARRIIEYYGLA